ncbi:uncharacterized protein LOC124796445 isoform X1 [Schistocerca piceifrons]|uniref:uncharacterized protein LOC124796445 isoform X1 n=1 Tax=Schistocerca piceifrons TaxID=274613 RepID=UPI001F5FB949|nr:uncharacterized protein LOC124796445 isoform X1 [Schistocerca piceifrons]
MRVCLVLCFAAVAVATVAAGYSPWQKGGWCPPDCAHNCTMECLNCKCPGECSLEMNRVVAWCDGGWGHDRKVLREFVNCCGWQREICLYGRECEAAHHVMSKHY